MLPAVYMHISNRLPGMHTGGVRAHCNRCQAHSGVGTGQQPPHSADVGETAMRVGSPALEGSILSASDKGIVTKPQPVETGEVDTDIVKDSADVAGTAMQIESLVPERSIVAPSDGDFETKGIPSQVLVGDTRFEVGTGGQPDSADAVESDVVEGSVRAQVTGIAGSVEEPSDLVAESGQVKFTGEVAGSDDVGAGTEKAASDEPEPSEQEPSEEVLSDLVYVSGGADATVARLGETALNDVSKVVNSD